MVHVCLWSLPISDVYVCGVCGLCGLYMFQISEVCACDVYTSVVCIYFIYLWYVVRCMCICGLYLFQNGGMCLCVCVSMVCIFIKYLRSVRVVSLCRWSVSIPDMWGLCVWCLCVGSQYLFHISDVCVGGVCVTQVCIYFRYLMSVWEVSVCLWSVSISNI